MHCTVQAETLGRTGVEMEALTAVQVGLLTVYDMCKAADRGMVMGDIRLLEKRGGKSGDWVAPAAALMRRAQLSAAGEFAPRHRPLRRLALKRRCAGQLRRAEHGSKNSSAPGCGTRECARQQRALSSSPCAASACAQAIIKRMSSNWCVARLKAMRRRQRCLRLAEAVAAA